MKKLAFAAALLGVAAMAACCAAQKASVTNIQATHDILTKKLLAYVDADKSLSDADKRDWHAMIDSDQRNIDALRNAVGN